MTQQQLLDPGKGTPKKSRRRERDAYYTPEWPTQVLMDRVPELRGWRLLDPCCGDGRMARALAGRFTEVARNDIDPSNQAASQGWHRDACDPWLYQIKPCVVTTNPPFVHASRIAWTALEHARVAVALLLRITFLEPVEDRQWLKRVPPTRQIVLPRISFDGTGETDSATCAWFIWLRGPDGQWQKGSIEVAGADVGQEALAL